ncbi:aldo/keto reductase [Zwartia sp.]|uniref:aldo/keto reductase n=1 Tax=Zwartia sp. TaxID=2978004 RepID=UPI003BAF8689
MMNRRTWLQTTLTAASASALSGAWAQTLANTGPLITRPIPSSGQRLPIIGLGSSATFAQVARTEDREALKNVMAKMVELGGTVFDTAPSYGASEEVAGKIAQDLGIAQKLFWATKLNVAPRGGGAADAAAAHAQLEMSFKRIGKPVIDLVQIHNMGDVQTQLPILREAKEKGRIRYLGITTTFSNQYDSMIDTMRSQKIDFIGTNYAIDDLFAEKTILPLAQERGIAVLVYAPFGRTRLWSRVKGQAVPEWAKEFDATTWAQFFLKFVASHPAVTCITPATSRVSNMIDNMAGGVGRLPDAAMRKRMIQLIDSLPNA